MPHQSFMAIIAQILIWAIPIIFAITLHEAAHGWVASKLGDNTAKVLGRVTANPLKHIDLLGTIILPITMLILGGFIFGWAKPVPVNYQQLHHPRRDMALVACAGPVSNLIMALAWCFIGKLALQLGGNLSDAMIAMAKAGIYINSILAILNILPLPPLDGSRVIAGFMPMNIAHAYNRIEPYGFWILLALLFSGILSKIMMPPLTALVGALQQLMGLG